LVEFEAEIEVGEEWREGGDWVIEFGSKCEVGERVRERGHWMVECNTKREMGEGGGELVNRIIKTG